MQSVNEFKDALKQALGWNKSRTECLSQIVLCLIMVRTVNLKQLACAMSGQAQLDSNYRRLQRFFSQMVFPKQVVARLIAGIFFCLMSQYIFPWTDQIGSGVNRTLTYWY